MAAAVGRLLRGSVARHVNAISGGISAPTTLRPAACGRTHLMNILWSGSSPAFSTSSSYRAPAVTQHAPYFKGTAVVNGEFKDLSLDDFKGKYLVLFFYPLDLMSTGPASSLKLSTSCYSFCQSCKMALEQWFLKLAYKEVHTIREDKGLVKSLLVLMSGITTEKRFDMISSLENACQITNKGLFIIDPNGVIKHLSVNDLPVGRSVEETLRLVKAFQFVEAHGEVCPANWTPDSPTIKPNPTASKEYFEKVNQ
uniref:thioredoxin-dependent peroxiredoxin n=1 Tax=Otolemur garnettii TaxID=30611 RepID=H0WJZ5_OTOGA